MSRCTLLSPRELAAETGWPEKRIRFLITRGSIRYLKLNGRYLLPKDALIEFIENHMVVPEHQTSMDQNAPMERECNQAQEDLWSNDGQKPRGANHASS